MTQSIIDAPTDLIDKQYGGEVASEMPREEIVRPLGGIVLETSVDNTHAELNSAEVSEEARKISQNLLRDFYQTYRLSQGSPEVQKELFGFISAEYRKDRELVKTLPGALDAAKEKVVQLVIPKRHSDTTDDDEFRDTWLEFVKFMNGEVDKDGSVELTMEHMLRADRDYQDTGRPGRNANEDSYESVIRGYVLGDMLPGSRYLLTVRDQFRRALLGLADTDAESEVSKLFQELQMKWEQKHPGKKFLEVGRVIS